MVTLKDSSHPKLRSSKRKIFEKTTGINNLKSRKKLGRSRKRTHGRRKDRVDNILVSEKSSILSKGEILQGISQGGSYQGSFQRRSSPTFTSVYNSYSMDNTTSFDTNLSDKPINRIHRRSSSQSRDSRSRSRSWTSNPPDRDASPPMTILNFIPSTFDTSDVNETFTNTRNCLDVNTCENISLNLDKHKPLDNASNWPKFIRCPSCTYENLFSDPIITELVCQLCFCPFDE